MPLWVLVHRWGPVTEPDIIRAAQAAEAEYEELLSNYRKADEREREALRTLMVQSAPK
jgi:hypothetical protein